MRGARGWRGKLRAGGGEEDCGLRAAHCPLPMDGFLYFSLFSLFWLPRFCEDVFWSGAEDRRRAYLTKIRTLERV